MSSVVETIVVAVVVAIAAAWGARAVWRSWKKGAVCSSCADSTDCPLVRNGQVLTDLQDFDPNRDCPS